MKQEIALDDDEMRKLNKENFSKTLNELHQYLNEGKKDHKATTIYVYVMLGIFCFFIIGFVVGGIIMAGSPTNFLKIFLFSGKENLQKIIVCYHNDKNMSFVSPEDSYNFLQTFDGSHCTIEERK